MVAQSVSQNAPIGISTSHHGLSQGGRCLCPDYKLETGSESCSSKHNPLVPGSSPGGPTNSEKATDFAVSGFFHSAESISIPETETSECHNEPLDSLDSSNMRSQMNNCFT